MKKILLLLITVTGIHILADAQTRFNAGIGYFGEKVTNPGFVLELESEKFRTDNFSLPLRGDLAYYANPDYHAFSIDLHKGFRKYFVSGLFVEQSIGVGIIAKSFKEDSYWYTDQYFRSIPHGNSTIWGFMPSVTAGIGYNLARDNEGASLIWIRPKIYWDLGFRGLHLPYAALQVGYTHTFKNK